MACRSRRPRVRVGCPPRLASTCEPLYEGGRKMARTVATDAYARKLFGNAAVFNFVVAAALLFLRPWVGPLVRLDPIAGTNLAFAYLSATPGGGSGPAYLASGR